MDALGLYLLKSVTWLSGFTLVFLLFLRNERFFNLNRFYLLAGLIASFIFPFITIRYTVFLPAPVDVIAGAAIPEKVGEAGNDPFTIIWIVLSILYLSGALILIYQKVRQSRSVIRTIRNAAAVETEPVRLIRTNDFTSSFSFFSYVFINPSITDTETREIMNHEKVHIRQKHWIDLMLAEALCVIQWFNPLVWIYIRFIKQNHEYLADEAALQSTSDPEVYKATLLNQIVGYPVVGLSNSFNYSLNKKRFLMMKNIITSPYRKMKILFIIPVLAVILYAFATPEYRYNVSGTNSGNTENIIGQQEKALKGVVVMENGTPLAGATIILRGTTIGTITDLKGSFALTNVPDGAPLIVSYVGYKSKVVKPAYNENMSIQMVRDTISIVREKSNIETPPPPPPPPSSGMGMKSNSDGSPSSGVRVRSNSDGPPPLIIIDGVDENLPLSTIDPESIASMSVMKGETAVKKYGEKGKNGVIEVTTKKVQMKSTGEAKKEVTVVGYGQEKQQFVAVESLPGFPGGTEAMMKWISDNIKYPPEAVKANLTGNVMVSFMVDSKGKVKDVKAVQPVNKYLDAEAIRLISSMPDWKPGTQGGKPVDVIMQIPIKFSLK